MHPVLEPDANLVARARLKLDEALDALPPRRWYHRLGQSIMNNFASLRAAPMAACLLLVVGAGAGSLGGYQFAQNRGARTREIATVNTPPQTLNVQTQAQAPPQGAPAEIATSPASFASRTAIWLKCTITNWCRRKLRARSTIRRYGSC